MKKLTKEMLLEYGVTDVKENGDIYVHNKLCKQSIGRGYHKYGKTKEYLFISLTDHNRKKLLNVTIKRKDGTTYKKQAMKYYRGTFGVHRIVYAWFNGCVPEKYDVDHIDNDSLNNNLSNLRILTRKENLKCREKSQKEIYREYMLIKNLLERC